MVRRRCRPAAPQTVKQQASRASRIHPSIRVLSDPDFTQGETGASTARHPCQRQPGNRAPPQRTIAAPRPPRPSTSPDVTGPAGQGGMATETRAVPAAALCQHTGGVFDVIAVVIERKATTRRKATAIRIQPAKSRETRPRTPTGAGARGGCGCGDGVLFGARAAAPLPPPPTAAKAIHNAQSRCAYRVSSLSQTGSAKEARRAPQTTQAPANSQRLDRAPGHSHRPESEGS